MENHEQNMTYKFQVFEQQIMAIQQQINAIEKSSVEMASLGFGLDEIKKEKDIIASVGMGIFVNAKTTSEELLVDIGGNNFVTKSIPETKKLIQEQLEKLDKAKEELNFELEKISEELTNTILEHQNKKK